MVDFTAQQGYQAIEFDITELARAWLNGTYPNYGMVLIPETLYIDPPGSPTNNYTGLLLSDNAVSDYRPKLTLIPEPATILLIGLGIACLRRKAS